jgi:hypothetical protein
MLLPDAVLGADKARRSALVLGLLQRALPARGQIVAL